MNFVIMSDVKADLHGGITKKKWVTDNCQTNMGILGSSKDSKCEKNKTFPLQLWSDISCPAYQMGRMQD